MGSSTYEKFIFASDHVMVKQKWFIEGEDKVCSCHEFSPALYIGLPKNCFLRSTSAYFNILKFLLKEHLLCYVIKIHIGLKARNNYYLNV